MLQVKTTPKSIEVSDGKNRVNVYKDDDLGVITRRRIEHFRNKNMKRQLSQVGTLLISRLTAPSKSSYKDRIAKLGKELKTVEYKTFDQLKSVLVLGV